MTRFLFAIPGDLAARTGGYGYDRRVLAALPGQGVEAVHLPLPGSFPRGGAEDAAAAVRAVNGALAADDVVLMDGLAFGVLPPEAIRAIAAPIIALCHHPLCLEAGLAPARAEALRESERRALALAAHVIVTSPHTAVILTRDFGVPERRISIALPGSDRAPRARGADGAVALLAVGSIIPRKAFDVLIEALAGLADLDWRLRLAGSPDHSPATAAAVNRLIAGRGLGARVELLGELAEPELDRLFATSDIFVSSSLYEGYGMALAEAMARGLPIIATMGGAAADTVPAAAALKIPPGDALALRAALRALLGDAPLRARLAEASWRAGQALPRWEDAARVIAGTALNVGREAA